MAGSLCGMACNIRVAFFGRMLLFVNTLLGELDAPHDSRLGPAGRLLLKALVEQALSTKIRICGARESETSVQNEYKNRALRRPNVRSFFRDALSVLRKHYQKKIIFKNN